MESSFSIVVLGAVVLSVLVMLVVLVISDRGTSGESVYDQIGQGGLSSDGDAPDWTSAPGAVWVDSPAGLAEQEREVRQMLEARSERMVRRGQPPLDIDAEVAKLLQPQPHAQDPGLEREVRQLVTAKNERRARKGEEPLDVEAEVVRTLAELTP
jgi:hypothetical protein